MVDEYPSFAARAISAKLDRWSAEEADLLEQRLAIEDRLAALSDQVKALRTAHKLFVDDVANAARQPSKEQQSPLVIPSKLPVPVEPSTMGRTTARRMSPPVDTAAPKHTARPGTQHDALIHLAAAAAGRSISVSDAKQHIVDLGIATGQEKYLGKQLHRTLSKSARFEHIGANTFCLIKAPA